MTARSKRRIPSPASPPLSPTLVKRMAGYDQDEACPHEGTSQSNIVVSVVPSWPYPGVQPPSLMCPNWCRGAAVGSVMGITVGKAMELQGSLSSVCMGVISWYLCMVSDNRQRGIQTWNGEQVWLTRKIDVWP